MEGDGHANCGGAGTARVERARITRPDLAERIRTALADGSLLITAGAGFGKTSILREALARSRRVGWVSAAECEPARSPLLRLLTSEVERVVPGTPVVMDRPPPVDARMDARQLMARLERRLSDRLVVVIDDAEHLEDAPGALELLTELVRADSASVGFAVVSRRPLGLRLAKARAEGRLAELSSGDLNFTAPECAELMRAWAGREPDEAELEALLQATGGCVLAVSLAIPYAIAGPAGPPSGGLAAGPALETYVREEVLDRLPRERRDSLLVSSLPRTLTPGTLAALELPPDFPREIERSGALLMPPVAAEEGVAYYPLFRRPLRSALDTEFDPESLGRLHAAVAVATAAEGKPGEAIEHWLEAEAWEDAAACLEREGQGLIRSSPDLIRRWLARLPAEHRRRPRLLLLAGQLRWGEHDYPRATGLLVRATDELRATGDGPDEWRARLLLGDSLGSMGDIDGAVAAAGGFDGPAGEEGGAAAAAAGAHAAMMLAAYCRFEESERVAARARRHSHGELVAASESIRLTFNDLPRGQLDRAVERLRAAFDDDEWQDPFGLRLYAGLALADVLQERGEPDAALEAWSAIEERSEYALAPAVAHACHAGRAKVLVQADRLDEARVALARANPPEHGWHAYAYHVARAHVAAVSADGAEVRAAAERSLEIQCLAPPVHRLLGATDLVPPLVAVGHRARAAEVIAEALALVDKALPGAAGALPRGRLRALRAWLNHEDGEREAAAGDLAAMWRQTGQARRFVLRRDWDRIAGAVSDALEDGKLEPVATVDAVAAAFPDGAPLVELAGHPRAAVRRAALEPAVASGHPGAKRRLRTLAADRDADIAAEARRIGDRRAVSVPPLRVEMLGGFQVRRGAWPIPDTAWERPSAARLARFLLVNPGEPVPGAAIAEALWPKLAPEGGRRSLQVAVSRVRGALDPPGAPGTMLVETEGAYRLVLGRGDTVDVAEFEAAAELALAERGGNRARLLERARSLWGGEPLPAVRYEEWTLAWRQRLVDRYAEVLAALVQVTVAGGNHPAAIRAAGDLVDLDPVNEGAHRELMVAYARGGRPGRALRQYLECRRALIGELGVEPTEATSRLQARILAGEAV